MAQKKVYLYLDDSRQPNMNLVPSDAKLVVAKSYTEAVAAMQKYCDPNVTELYVDLDNKLNAVDHKTGIHFCLWLIRNGYNTNENGHIRQFKFHIHTLDITAIEKMEMMFKRYGWEVF